MADRIEIICRRIVAPKEGGHTTRQGAVIESRVTAVVYESSEGEARDWLGRTFDEVAGKAGANPNLAQVTVERGINTE